MVNSHFSNIVDRVMGDGHVHGIYNYRQKNLGTWASERQLHPPEAVQPFCKLILGT